MKLIRPSGITVLTVLFLMSITGITYGQISTQKEVFQIIADDIYKSNKRRVAIIDFPNKKGGEIEEGKNFVEEMAISLQEIIGSKKEKVWVVSGESLMNALEKDGIIQNGIIVNKERARKFWETMGIEIVITGLLVSNIDLIDYRISLFDTVNGKKLNNRDRVGTLELDDTITRGSQSTESTTTTHDAYTPLPPSTDEKVSQHFLNSHTPTPATLEKLGEILKKTLSDAGFKCTRCLSMKEGFALVLSPTEFRFSADGSHISFSAPIARRVDRFVSRIGLDYFFNLYFSPKKSNVYQAVSVIVTSEEVYFKKQPEIKFQDVQNLINNGGLTFPEKLKNENYNKDKHKCFVLLYAFEENPSGNDLGPLGNKIQFVTSTANLKKINKIREPLEAIGLLDKK